jgi:hypothetical protein
MQPIEEEPGVTLPLAPVPKRAQRKGKEVLLQRVSLLNSCQGRL